MPESIPTLRREFIDLLPQDRIKVFHLPGPVAEANPENRARFKAASLIREHFLNELRPDVIHISSLFEGLFEESVTSLGLLTSPEKTVVTLYDLIPLVERKKYLAEDFKLDYYMSKIGFLKKAGLLLSISEFSRQEAIDLLGLPPETVVNMSSAIGGFFRPIDIPLDVAANLRAKLGISGKFLMYTGSFDQRKNHETLIKGYASLPRGMRKKYQLLIVGNGWEGAYQHLHGIAKREGLEPSELVFSGHVSDEELLRLYNICTLFVFPSLREGFGLPILEAMSCGVPAIGSNATSIPEVIGIKEALFDPTNHESIGKKILESLTNDAFYKKLAENAVSQAAKFSWDRTATIALNSIEARLAKSDCNRTSSTASKVVEGGKRWFPALKPSVTLAPLINELSSIEGIRAGDQASLLSLANCIARNSASLEAAIRTDWNMRSPQRVGWVTTWNTRCGIATYTIPVIKAIPACHWIFAPYEQNLVEQDDDRVIRCWTNGAKDDLTGLAAAIEDANIDALIIQFNFGFFDFSAFSKFLITQVAAGRIVLAILHSTQDPDPRILDRKLADLVGALNRCFLFVHTTRDVERLAQLGLVSNVFLLPLGMHEERPSTVTVLPAAAKRVIGTYGFALPNKGLVELVDAFAIVSRDDPRLHLMMVNAEYPVPESRAYLESVKERVQSHGLDDRVTMITDYLPNEDSIGYLSCAELIVIPYQSTTESSSGSARMALASGRPVAVTPLAMFDDMRSAVLTLPGTSARDMATGIRDILDSLGAGDDNLLERVTNNARLWVNAHGFSGVGRYLFSTVLELIESRAVARS